MSRLVMDNRMSRLAAASLLFALAVAVLLASRGQQSLVVIALAAVGLGLGSAISVAAPSGRSVSVGFGIATAIPLVLDEFSATLAALIFGTALAWQWRIWFKGLPERSLSAILADLVAVGGLASGFFGVIAVLEYQFVAGQFALLVATTAGGITWFVLRSVVMALVGLDRDDLSTRFLWLLALEDWPVIVTLFTAGALYGLSYEAMGLWAIPVSILPYAFSHLAFMRYASTRRTYGQTIRALAQIPEVAGLAPIGHASRTAKYALAMAQELGLHPAEIIELEYAALLHDIGRITLNEPAILRAGFSDEDISRWGSQIVAEAPHLRGVAALVRDQHRGYRVPGQVDDPEVTLAARVIKVASAYDQLTQEQERSSIDALEQLHRGAAYDFDPTVIRSLRRVLVHDRVIDR